MTAADAVVLPIPMSPVTSAGPGRRPSSRRDQGADVEGAHASSAVRAGPVARLAVPLRDPQDPRTRSGAPDRPATPTSTMMTWPPPDARAR